MRSPKVRKIVERAHDAVLASIRQPIGRSDVPINSFFVYLGSSAATALVAQAQKAFVTERMDPKFAGLPMLSAVSPSKAGGLGGARNFTNIAAGQLTLRSMADLYVYPNKVAASRLTGGTGRAVAGTLGLCLQPNSARPTRPDADEPSFRGAIISRIISPMG